MKKFKLFGVIGGLMFVGAAFFLTSADHIDAPLVASTSSDIADFYAFEGDNPNNTVFIATLQGPLGAGEQTQMATFDENVMVEFNIDNTGDFKEDLVIQAIKRGDSMYFFGPIAPGAQGLESAIETSAPMSSVRISAIDEVQTTDANGMKFFAGARRDNFYFDFNRFNQIIAGEAAPDGFFPADEASDLFLDLNVLAIVVEVPNSMLDEAPEHIAVTAGLATGLPNAYNVWVSTKRKQL